MLCTLAVSFSAVSEEPATQSKALSLKIHNQNLPKSYAIAVSPDNEIWVTHREGTLGRYTTNGQLLVHYELDLKDLYYAGQGGLLGITFHPQYTSNKWVYLSYSYGDVNANGLKVIRVKLSENNIADDKASETEHSNGKVSARETIFEQSSLRTTAAHYGARMVFMPDGSLLVTTGDGFNYREQAQVLSSQMGKTLRLNEDGSTPIDNPFVSEQNKLAQQVYSYGHRNPQGLILMPDGRIIGHEHGPAGGDEVNIITAGNNYGWPVITEGKDYIGGLISPFTTYDGMQQATYNWTPSIAPAGMIYFTKSTIPLLQNRLLITSLKYKQLHTLKIEGQKVSDEIIFFANSEYRMRDITQSEEGRIFILSDSNPAHILEIVDN